MKNSQSKLNAKQIHSLISLVLKCNKGAITLVAVNALIALVILAFFGRFTYEKKASKTETVTSATTFHIGAPNAAKTSADKEQLALKTARSFNGNQLVTLSKSVEANLNVRRLVAMSIETPNPGQSKSNKLLVAAEFSYYQPSDAIPDLAPASLSLTAKNPVARICNKTARMNMLQWKLNELPEVPTALMLPKTINVKNSAATSEADALRELEKSLDQSIASLEKFSQTIF
jgi:hypothetical protein